jgi:hypothetical protein
MIMLIQLTDVVYAGFDRSLNKLYAILRKPTSRHSHKKTSFMFHYRETFVTLHCGEKSEV